MTLFDVAKVLEFELVNYSEARDRGLVSIQFDQKSICETISNQWRNMAR